MWVKCPWRIYYAPMFRSHQIGALFPTLARPWEACGALIKTVDFLAQPHIFGNRISRREAWKSIF